MQIPPVGQGLSQEGGRLQSRRWTGPAQETGVGFGFCWEEPFRAWVAGNQWSLAMGTAGCQVIESLETRAAEPHPGPAEWLL